jgi:dynein heavy chain
MRAMKDYLELVSKELDELAVMIRSGLSSNDRRKFSTALIVDMHARDMIETFVRDR